MAATAAPPPPSLHGPSTSSIPTTTNITTTIKPNNLETMSTNSSFEESGSGAEDSYPLQPTGGGSGEDLDPYSSSTSPPPLHPSSVSSDHLSKKRRKQSRPIRIPTTSVNPGSSDPIPPGGQAPPCPPGPLNLSASAPRGGGSIITTPTTATTTTTPLPTPPPYSPTPHPFPLSTSLADPFSSLFGGSGGLHSFSRSCGAATTTTTSSSNGSAHLPPLPLPPPRIFNPEAYCDLCHKEFCNKYFLKTHKANKHGVYSDVTSSSTGPPTIHHHSSGIKTNTAGGGGGLFHLGLPPMGEGGGSRGGSSSTLNLHNPPPHPDQSSTRESFCELCHKDFCNKYFLKRHRRKTHGLDPDSEDGTTSTTSNSNGASHINIKEEVEEGELDPISRQPHQPSSSSATTTSIDPQNGLNLSSSSRGLEEGTDHQRTHFTCGLCLQDFRTTPSLQSHLLQVHRIGSPTTTPLPSFLHPFEGYLEEEGSRSPPGGPPSEHLDFECSSCNRSFGTIYLLRMHKSYFHPRTTTPGSGGPPSPPPRHGHDGGGSGGSEDANGRERPSSSSPRELKGSTTTPSPLHGGGDGGDGEEEEEEEGLTSEDSDELRRLQSMIMELNRVSGGGLGGGLSWSPPPNSFHPGLIDPTTSSSSSSIICPICGKEFYSTYFLAQHMTQSHLSPSTPDPEGQGSDGRKEDSHSLRCEERSRSSSLLESKHHKGRREQHHQELFLSPAHPPGGGGVSGTHLTSSGGKIGGLDQGPKRPSPSLSRSYCTICHKELCNKYFMRTHMLKMHGISIDSSTGLGGVTCDICHKELCSKYFLKVHKHNTHGIVEDGPSPPGTAPPPPFTTSDTPPIIESLTTPPPLHHQQSDFQGGGCGGGSPSDSGGGGSGGGLISEPCPLCSRRFRSLKWLKGHLVSDHGEEGREKWKGLTMGLRRSTPTTTGSSSEDNNGVNKTSTTNSKCNICGFNPPTTQSLLAHLSTEHGLEPSRGGDVSSPGGGGGGGTQSPTITQNQPQPRPLPPPPHHPPGLLDPLSLLFGKLEEGGGSGKGYRCGYCPFSTPLLVYLYAHERTHTGLGNNNNNNNNNTNTNNNNHNNNNNNGVNSGGGGHGGGGLLQCPLCFQSFQALEPFQQHLMSHQLSGVLAPLFTPTSRSSSGGTSGGVGGGGFLPIEPSPFLPTGLIMNGGGPPHPPDPSTTGRPWTLPQQIGKAESLRVKVKEEEKEEEEVLEEPKGKRARRVVVVTQFACRHCGVRFQTREDARDHLSSTHPNLKHVRKKGKRGQGQWRRTHITPVPPRRRSRVGTMRRTFTSNIGGGYGDGVLVQSFHVREESPGPGRFLPSLIRVRVRERVLESLRVSLRLSPLGGGGGGKVGRKVKEEDGGQ